ncbi:LytTR family DNA-binding domain-containing protein [Aquimarina sp. 2201CG1-2-11]|uniref:LytR/AlgR family response regulator transcription factor n=1 Tax=Aquimarina discodermiae TaxID=3231043 RepID=UPI003461AC08
MYFFFENLEQFDFSKIFKPSAIVRSSILINSTVFFISAIYILLLYFKEREKNEETNSKTIELKSNRRTHIIPTDTIIYIEGLGNYVNYHLNDNSKITVYTSLKLCLLQLESDNFIRIQKSFIINTSYLRSYDNDTVEMKNGISLPIGAKFNSKKLSIHKK